MAPEAPAETKDSDRTEASTAPEDKEEEVSENAAVSGDRIDGQKKILKDKKDKLNMKSKY